MRGSRWIARWWSGWHKSDLASLTEQLDEPGYWTDGMVRLSPYEFTAIAEMNGRALARNPTLPISPLLVWVDGRGLIKAIKVG